ARPAADDRVRASRPLRRRPVLPPRPGMLPLPVHPSPTGRADLDRAAAPSGARRRRLSRSRAGGADRRERRSLRGDLTTVVGLPPPGGRPGAGDPRRVPRGGTADGTATVTHPADRAVLGWPPAGGPRSRRPHAVASRDDDGPIGGEPGARAEPAPRC